MAINNFENIPTQLKRVPNWIVWRWKLEGDIWKKPPHLAHGKTHVFNGYDQPHYATFERAVERYQQSQTGTNPYHGIGLILQSWMQTTIIDLDNKTANPASPERLEEFRRLCGELQTYAEVSVSGTGVHIICKGNLPQKYDGSYGHNFNHMEMYDRDRYMTFTGNQDMSSVQFWPQGLAPVQEINSCEPLLSNLSSWMDEVSSEASGKPASDKHSGVYVPVTPDNIQQLIEAAFIANYSVCASCLGQSQPYVARTAICAVCGGYFKNDCLIELPQVKTDEQIYDWIRNHGAAEQIIALAQGNYRALGYHSASQADFMLIRHLCNATDCNSQALRIFRTMPASRRHKVQANNDFVRSIKKHRWKELERIIENTAFCKALLSGLKLI